MKKFLKYVSLFSVLFILICTILECMLRNVPNEYAFKRELIEKNGSKIRNLIIGSSVAEYGINPAYLPDSSYNLAIHGQWLAPNKKLLENYIQEMPNLKVIIWGLTTSILRSDYILGRDDEKISLEQIYLGLKYDNNPILYSELLNNKQSIEKLIEYYIKHGETMPCDSLGFNHTFSSSRARKGWEKITNTENNFVRIEDTDHTTQAIFHNNLQVINEALSICQKKGIHVYLILTPRYHAEGVNPEFFNEIRNEMTQIVQKWENATWLDYSHDSRFELSDFYDATHLNTDIGAVKFAKILKEDIW